MKPSLIRMHQLYLYVVLLTLALSSIAAKADPLPSWNETETKTAIINFVKSVTNSEADTFVPQEDRIAVFDNDGTLWAEKPVYFQFMFAIDRLQAMADEDPSVLSSDVLKAAARNDMETVVQSGKAGLLEIVAATHSNLSVDAFQAEAGDWLASATHPDTGMVYSDMIFQPMLELLSYLRDEGFTTYIVSGGGVHFIRAFSESAYNVPSNQVIGSTGKSHYEVMDGKPTVMKDPGIAFIDDKEGKPVAIDTHIGKRPILAGGNSDGDFQMLEWTTAGEGPRLGLIVHHTDSEREWAYDRESHIGTLDRGLDEAEQRGWVVIDMAADWEQVWPQSP
ncbi:HAD family hydrolase [Marinobacter fonticola]|uniref:HAD family hydrolase n=1 Tax=Marinobacter fonticola TaxID=2603215 RepID=UPI001D0D9B1D|nr:HAD family hydrolase [Marinobacter fonticola]